MEGVKCSVFGLKRKTMYFNAYINMIKIGIFHSLIGTMAISETTLKDAALMAKYLLNKG